VTRICGAQGGKSGGRRDPTPKPAGPSEYERGKRRGLQKKGTCLGEACSKLETYPSGRFQGAVAGGGDQKTRKRGEISPSGELVAAARNSAHAVKGRQTELEPPETKRRRRGGLGLLGEKKTTMSKTGGGGGGGGVKLNKINVFSEQVSGSPQMESRHEENEFSPCTQQTVRKIPNLPELGLWGARAVTVLNKLVARCPIQKQNHPG